MKKKLKLVFCLFEYVPFGGMQRDLLKIARECMARGHTVTIYAGYWQGRKPDDIKVSVVSVKGFANHRRCESFSHNLLNIIPAEGFDLVVGFNKMPGLGIYFCADTCFAAKAQSRGFLYRLTGRCRTYLRLEQVVFSMRDNIPILLLSEKEKEVYKKHYHTRDERFLLLPPGISRDCLAPDNAKEIRKSFREQIGILKSQHMVLMVGSGFKTKGVDRAIHAVAAMPSGIRETVLIIVGDDKSRSFQRLANRLHVGENVRFMGGRNDVRNFFLSADLLVHPSYRENTGSVLIEAMAAGLPVLATDVCGYSPHVERADAGRLIPSPFKQETMNKLMTEMLYSDQSAFWRKNGIQYVKNADVFNLHKNAADIIEQVAGC
jgi:UDP-glucose:(heptosyl)LPS alpha-1,3-glucosyltransferase